MNVEEFKRISLLNALKGCSCTVDFKEHNQHENRVTLMQKKKPIWFMYLVNYIFGTLIYYDFISILNKTPKCIVILGKIRKANKKNGLAETCWVGWVFLLNT